MKKNVNKNKYNFEPSRSTVTKLHWQSLSRFFRGTLVLFVSLFSIFFSHAEQFPVHITPQLISPYSLQLNDYYNGTNAKLMVTLINKDLLKPTISVRLRMSITSQSAKLTSKDYVYYPPIVLDAGIPLQLSLSDLAPYFNPDNLNFEGITRAQYQQQGKLPEGFYQFCFEAIEISTNQAVSLKKCASAWISLSDPPLLNLPRKAESVVFREPTNIIFNWTPRHLNSPNSAFNTEYDFQLVELWDNGIDPVAAFQTAQPLYQTTLNATTLLYGPGEPPLIPGKKYGWRVKAKAKSGIDDVDVFRNNGFSEVFWFTYQDNCQPPTNVTATVQNGRATLTWMPQPQMFEYTIEYREASPNGGGAGVQWFSQKTNATQTTIYDVQPGKTYEYRIGGSCSIGGGIVFGDPKAFTIPFRNTTRDSACGILPNINIANQTPLQTLVAGDVVLAGDFPVKLLQVSGMASFTGNGYVTVPFLGQARVKVKFNNIGVNTDNQLISGVIETTFDSTMKGIYDLDPIFEGGGNVGFVKSGADTANYTVDFVIGLPQDTVAIIPATDGKGGYIITIKGNNGNDYHLPVDSLPATIKDKDGNIYQIDKNGNLIPIGKPADLKGMTAAQLNNLATQKAVVKFVANPSQQYAFDEWKPVYDKSALWSEKYEKLSEGYRVNAKAIEAGKTDKVNAVISITDNTIKPENIKFITGKGTELTYKRNNNEYEINIIGGPAGDAQELYALYPDGDKYISLGKLLIASYQHQKKKLKLVPVNGTDIDESTVAAKLNEIYNKVGVEWEVTKDNNFDDHSWDANNNGLDIDGSGVLSTLTPEMKALNKAYKNSGRSIDDKTIYLFVLDKAAGQVNIAGDMPRAKQFGYLFTNSGADLGSTAVHEVGHGVFRLRHTFDGYFNGTDVSSSKNPVPDNVMNYPVGNTFSKLQWDALHDPGVVVGLFEKDEDGENLETNSIPGAFADEDKTFNFITITGKKITLPKQCVVSFNYGIASERQIMYPLSYLAGFKIKNSNNETIEFTGKINANGQFLGYFSGNNQLYQDTLTEKNKYNNVILFVPEKDGYYFIKYDAQLSPFANDEQILNYDEFPVQAYQNNAVLKRSDLFSYSGIRKIVTTQNEDWAINAEDLSNILSKHNRKAEHSYIIKLVELKTAYKKLFEQFTDKDCFENWPSDLQKSYTADAPPYQRVAPCNGKWEQILRSEPSLVTAFKDNQLFFYKRFIKEFIDFIKSKAQEKEGFLSTLSFSTTQKEASSFLSICSNNEIALIEWEKRKTLLQVLARNNLNDDEIEKNVVRLVKYLPKNDQDKLLTALITLKDADNNGLLLTRYIGQIVSDLNGQQFYDFINIIHTYANEKYQYNKSPFALGVNRKENRYFSFDPSFWVSKPVSIELKDDGKVQLAFRHQFTTNIYDAVEVNPYASITLHFEDDKSTNQFTLSKDNTYTTSGIMAYAICHSTTSDNLKIGAFVVLNTVLLTTGIGELNAAIAAGRTGGVILAGTDIALGVGSILVETKYKDKLLQSENGRDVLKFWENANLIWAGGRISQSLYNSATSARSAAATLKASADDAERAILEETEKQADNIISSGVNGEIKFAGLNGAGSLDDLVSWASKNGLSHLTQAEIKGTFDLFEGNITFAQKALLSSKEIVAGKTLPELAQHFNLPTIPLPQSLTPYQARVWYSWRKSQISTLVNRSNGMETAAREAVEMRNTIRITTRTSMKDVDIADFLNTKEMNMTWDEAFIKYAGDYEKIIEGSMRGRGLVDELFKIPK